MVQFDVITGGQIPQFQGRLFDTESFLIDPEAVFDSLLVADAKIDLAPGALYLISEDRYEELVVAGGFPYSWLTELDLLPMFRIFTQNDRDALSEAAGQDCALFRDAQNRGALALSEYWYTLLCNGKTSGRRSSEWPASDGEMEETLKAILNRLNAQR